MAVLSDPISASNIISRFEDYVRSVANSDIVWHAGNLPFPDFPASELGPSTGKAAEISAANLTGAIKASTLYNLLVAETNRYTRCRLLRALRYRSGDEPYYDFDATNKASMIGAYAQYAGISQQVGGPDAINKTEIENQMAQCRSGYMAAAANAHQFTVSVCHGSCHANCHGSRSRR